ncbi:MAG: hypothetical protein HN742_05525 [Lentisphaerae bacterium]|nr:hypothetical protein [Lentisphaerota bacterium]MBT5608437.1 hypothetical protein [Lentisphaerota bacterium]MBT7055163.1 hypothetical protein [Lentisphaerota bacterium]MBT7841309.1 hypothetical protein [Lentisphaerota bacterium]
MPWLDAHAQVAALTDWLQTERDDMQNSNSSVKFRSETPLLLADKPWEEGGILRAISVMPDVEEGRIRLYYLTWHRDDFTKNALCVAYTSDGFAWEKPDLGEGHNVVMRGSGRKLNWGCFFPQQVIHDPLEQDPALRWKMVYWDQPGTASPYGICFAASPDGFAWTPLSDYPAITNVNDGSCLIATHREGPCPWLKSNYLLYQQTWKYNPDLPVERDNLKNIHRRISLWASESIHGKWIGPIVVLEPDKDDPPDLQFYWLTAFHMKEGFGGFLSCHHTIDQTMDIQLVTSVDGWTWERRNGRRPILPLGALGQFDCGIVSSISGPMRIGDKVYMLYIGRARAHDQKLRYPELECPDPAAGIGIAELDSDVVSIP